MSLPPPLCVGPAVRFHKSTTPQVASKVPLVLLTRKRARPPRSDKWLMFSRARLRVSPCFRWHAESNITSVWCVFKGKDFCFGVNNEQYRCEMGYCCGETECCTYYYELWCKSLFIFLFFFIFTPHPLPFVFQYFIFVILPSSLSHLHPRK